MFYLLISDDITISTNEHFVKLLELTGNIVDLTPKKLDLLER